MSKLLSFLFLQHLFQTSSPFNKQIEVQELLGQRSLKVNGIIQTGPYIESVFNKAFKFFDICKSTPMQKALVLGVGGGHVVKKLHKDFPQSEITAVDLDEIIIDVGKRFFNLPNSPKVRYVIQDANNFVSEAKGKVKFDFIFVDLFIGNDTPSFVESPDFYKALDFILEPGGRIMLNYHGTPSFINQRKQLESFLPKIFIEHHTLIYGNEIFYLQKKK